VSGTTTVRFGDQYFWARDVGLSILVAETIGVIEGLSASERPWWLNAMLRDLRTVAVVPDFGLDVGAEWQGEQVDRLAGWIAEASRRLAARGAVTAAEAAAWQVDGDATVVWRGAAAVDTGPIVQLGRATVALVRGTLPPPPPGHRWFYGDPGGPHTIRRRD
jgi:hypothetical protein